MSVSRAESSSPSIPRLSVEERYKTIDVYLERLAKACRELVGPRYLLEEDVDRILKRQQGRAQPIFERIEKGPEDRETKKTLWVLRQGGGFPQTVILTWNFHAGSGLLRQLY